MVSGSLRKLREHNSLTQDDLAKQLGVSRQAICMWESGRRDVKSTMLKRIAKVLNVSVDRVINTKEINVKKGVAKMAKKIKKTVSKKTVKRVVSKKPTTKKVQFEVEVPWASQVMLAGDFNSWSTETTPLKKDKKGNWKVSTTLLPGRYEYKFVIDGQWWTDPSNSKTSTNSFGAQNSVKEVTR
ncbi:helix-turn-helix domain-containing protein [Candidatus Omnitrophota bacterium]